MIHRTYRLTCLLSVFASTALATTSRAADWPMYRGDAARSGYTAESLPDGLSLRWVYRSQHPPQPAWPRSARMPLDRAAHVVVADGTAYFGSSVTGKVYALDLETGRRRWSFFTDAPVRFAPAVRRDRVLVASDDGYLYALSAADGELLWKRRGGPDHSRLLGNQRMISKWPARGAPVVVDDTVYFAAGIWPSEGIFLHALDAETGETVWKNDDSGKLYMPQPHGGANATSGVSAQGYLVASGDRLLVPTGRAVPAAFDRITGKFQYFHLQQYGHRGGAPTMAIGPYFFNSGIPFNTASGKATDPVGGGPIAATADGIARADGKSVIAYQWTTVEKPDRKGNIQKIEALEELWRVDGVGNSAALVVAGDKYISGGRQKVVSVDGPTRKVCWEAELDGTAYGLAVSDARLLVSTDQGSIYCFDAQNLETLEVVEAEIDPAPYGENALVAAAAQEIVERGGVTKGYCLDLGCGDGALAYELARISELQIYAIDADPQNVARARRRLSAAGLYGSRVTVHLAAPDDTGYPDYFADLIVSGRAVAGGEAPPAGEVARLQRPSGGVAVIGPTGEMKPETRGPLDGAGEWTHQYTNAANTLCSADTLVRGDLGMLWFRDVDVDMPQRHGRGPAPLYCQGRLYAEGLDELVCVDAYNGRLIWRYPLPGILRAYDGDELMGAAGTGSNYCIADGSVYVRRDDHCLRIDAATGKPLDRFDAPRGRDGRPGTWGYVSSEGGLLFGTIADPDHVVTYRYINRGGDMKSLLTESSTLFALDAKTGQLKWRYDAHDSIRHNAIAVGGETVYVIDRTQADFDRTRARQPEDHPTGTLLALDANTGEIRWQNDHDIYGTMLALSTEQETLLMSYQPTSFRLASEIGGRLTTFSTADGTRRWEKPASYSSRPLINGTTIYAQGGAWDLITGEDRTFNFSRSYGCGVLSASRSMMLFRSATLGYFDLDKNQEIANYGGLRPGCWINAIPAGGLVLMPDASAGCQCSYLNRAWIALAPVPSTAP